ncbi:unnamed protein product [Ectocarpus sp. CCAP 1310/34]|nr:unnamed protein product [Ectocarpus sp. CCAP 1310/34]
MARSSSSSSSCLESPLHDESSFTQLFHTILYIMYVFIPLVNRARTFCRLQENVKLWLKKMALLYMHGVRYHAYARIGDHPGAKEHATIRLFFEGARLLNFTFVKGHQLEQSDLHILAEVLPFVTPTVVALVEEMDAYNVAAAETDAGCDLWAFWHDNRLKLPAWIEAAALLKYNRSQEC